MNKDKVNQAIGELMTREKYKFVDHRIIGEVIRDFLKYVGEYNE